MSDDAKIDELLDRWEELREQGESMSSEELCHDCPELLDALNEQIFALRWVPCPDADAAAAPYQVSFTTRDIDGQQIHHESVPKTLGRYELKQPIGAGGFGQVWLAYDPELRRDVAIKIPRRDRAPSPGDTDRFLEEARKVAQLRHPNIVPVHDVGQEGTCRYIVSEWIDGTDLARHISCGRVSFSESARIVADAAEALHHAHLRNIVHRDVKPGNILLGERGELYVADFGIAATEDELLAEDNVVSGTLPYMSPEQVSGESHRVNARSDIYSLGIVAYELLTGRLPFRAGTPGDLRSQILSGEPRPPRTIDDSISPELETVCLKAMSKDPAQRYSTAKDMAVELRKAQALLSGSGVAPTAASPTTVARVNQQRARLLVASVTALIIVIVGLVGLFAGGFFSEPNRHDTSRIGDGGAGSLPPGGAEATEPTAETIGGPPGRKLPPQPPPKPVPATPRMAVLYFENQSSETEDLAAFEKGLCSMMIDQLKRHSKLDLVERVRIQEIFDELKLSRRSEFDQATVANIGRLVGAEYLVLGSFFEAFGTFRIDARIVEVETGSLVATAGVSGTAEQFDSLLGRLAGQLRDDSPWPREPIGGGDSPEHKLPAKAVRRYGEALDAIDQGDRSKAASIINEVLATYPEFVLARAVLATETPNKQ